MNYIKSNGLKIILIVGLLLSGCIIYIDKKEIKDLDYQISEIENKNTSLTKEKELLLQDLDDCLNENN